MMRFPLTLSALTLFAGVASAQKADVGADGQSVSKSVIVVSRDGKTYRKVVENGRVVEESGDPGLGRGIEIRIGAPLDLDALLERARRSGARANAGGRLRGVADLDLPEEIEQLLESGKLDLDRLFEKAREAGETAEKVESRVIVVKQGEKIVDERPRDGDAGVDIDVDVGDRIQRVRALRRRIERLQRQLDRLERGGRGNGRREV